MVECRAKNNVIPPFIRALVYSHDVRPSQVGVVKMKIELKSPPESPLAYRVKDFCELVGISNATLYKYVNLGKIRVIKIGGRTLVPAAEVARLLSGGAT